MFKSGFFRQGYYAAGFFNYTIKISSMLQIIFEGMRGSVGRMMK